jgi:predicted DNA-binding protein YlxM (UPF0122 family)
LAYPALGGTGGARSGKGTPQCHLLTARQAEILGSHYNEDYSLAEIAEGLNISRQAAHDALRAGSRALMEYESKLGLVRAHHDEVGKEMETRGIFMELRSAISQIQRIASGSSYHAGDNDFNGKLSELDAITHRLEESVFGK